jgi:hypothetical protein
MCPITNACKFCDRTGMEIYLCFDCLKKHYDHFDWNLVATCTEWEPHMCYVCLQQQTFTTNVVMCEECREMDNEPIE